MEDLLIPVLGIICAVGLPVLLISIIVFKNIQAKHTERLAMIEKGVVLGEPERPVNHFKALRNGLLLIGLALGAFIGLFISETWLRDSFAGDFIIAIMTILFGGIAFLVYFFISRSLLNKDENQKGL